MPTNETTGTDLTFKQKAAWLCALLLIGALVLSAALYPVFQQRAQAEKERIALIEKEQAEAAKQAKVAAAKVGKTAKKRKGKMVKIALGQTKQADSNGTHNGAFLGTTSDWIVGTGGSATATSDTPDGWLLTSGGMVTVPITAALGIYQAGYCQNPEEPDSPQKVYDLYEFEVVCIEKITITAEKIN